MPKPPSSPATPRPAPELLARLTTLAQELAGAFRPATVIEAVARALAELLKPDRLSVILLDAESNRLAVTYDTHPVPARTDDRSEEHTSELQSPCNLVCRLLLAKKKTSTTTTPVELS